jgi:hypothetical protein
MGLCGETTIANKKASWVTMIQVSLCTGCQPWKLELIALSRFYIRSLNTLFHITRLVVDSHESDS